ncbi:MAG: DUF393 domain-containing protein, partial [Pseudomonadota bacterium]
MHTETEIIYNNSCPICSREIAAYQRYAEARALALDFTALDQADLASLGLTEDDAARRLHVIHEGKLLSGVDAFAVLWAAMPRFRWLSRLVRLPVIRPLAELVYERILAPLLFSWHRRQQLKAN